MRFVRDYCASAGRYRRRRRAEDGRAAGFSAHVLLTTPGASKWYKANGREASQQLKFDLETGANLEWLPQENILFDGAMPNLSTTVNLASGAAYAGWEVLCFGRQASNELWLSGQFKQRLQILRNYRLIWQECAFCSQKVVCLLRRLVYAGMWSAEVLLWLPDWCRMIC